MLSTNNLLKETVVEGANYIEPLQFLEKLNGLDNIVFLDGSSTYTELSQYSYIGVKPFLKIEYKEESLYIDGEFVKKDLWEYLHHFTEKYFLPSNKKCPADFHGGLVGYFGYELNHTTEVLPKLKNDNYQIPDLILCAYSSVIVFDNQNKKMWYVSNGIEKNFIHSKEVAYKQIEEIKKINVIKKTKTAELGKVTSNFSEEEYIQKVEKVKQYIRQGDIFQTNISQQFQVPYTGELDSLELYKVLTKNNPAPFSCFLNFNNCAILSCSPERFLKVKNQEVETRPIKGTIKRKLGIEDEIQKQKLLRSEKDFAENIMIVDLMRNDLSKVCTPESVIVTKACGLETFATVHHLVSVVKGTLKKNEPIKLLEQSFPGGSITGAPKVRAMEIISEIENTKRGPYCGAIGYLGFNKNMDTSIVIRTITENKATKKLLFQAGGAVVIDSNSKGEYKETLVKSYAIHKILEDFQKKEALIIEK